MPPCRYSQAWLPASSWLRGEGKELESSVEVLLASSLRTKRKPQPNCLADILGSLRLRKRHLKSEVALLQTLSLLFHLVQFVKCWQSFLELNSKWLYRSSGKEKESRLSLLCLVFTFSTKREISYFHVVVVQWWRRNTAISRKVVGKNVHATIPKGDMGYDQYTFPDTVAVEPTFVAFL